MSGIIWLASYPKSGNTWFRIFLANLLSNSATAVDINTQLDTANFASREHFDRAIGWESSELTVAQVASLRLRAQEVLAVERPGSAEKTHDAFTEASENKPLFSKSATQCALYFVRNPLDIAVSFSHHSASEIDSTIAFMNNPDARSFAERNQWQLPQFLRDWSGHVTSWLDAPDFPVLAVRYEDMLDRPEETFARACRFAGWPDEPSRIRRALHHSRFEAVQQQEKEKGFSEASPNQVFFREGRFGVWRNCLSRSQVEALVRCHTEVMRRFGYLNANGSLAD